jgi:sugar/nucleoside kinase (ribokinase family)
MPDLICLGNITIDDVVLHDGTTQMGCFGGDAIYAALSAAMWIDNVQFVAPVGNDYPDENLQYLNNSGWDLSGLPVRAVPTHRNWVIYENDGRRTWVLRTNSENFFTLSPLVNDIPVPFRYAKAFLILAMDLAAQENLVRGLSRGEALVALDPQEDNLPGNEDRVFKMLEGVDIFLPSEIEVYRLLGHNDYERAARQFSQVGCQIVGIKLGELGSLLYDANEDRFHRIPIYPTRVIDTTGAGDSFSGGFMAQYLQSQDLLQAGLAGAVSASFAVEGFGLTHLFDVGRDDAKARFDVMLKQMSEV